MLHVENLDQRFVIAKDSHQFSEDVEVEILTTQSLEVPITLFLNLSRLQELEHHITASASRFVLLRRQRFACKCYDSTVVFMRYNAIILFRIVVREAA
jgi:hypothetical protein